MSHHRPKDERRSRDEKGGLEVEKWILRFQLLAMVALAVTAVVASRDDIRRYVKIRQM